MIRSSSLRSAVLGTYVVAMLAVFLMPVPPSPASVPAQFDKLVHVALFMGLVLLLLWSTSPARPHRVVVTLGAAVALAAVIEALQAMLPYRNGDLVDFAAGAAGALLGALLGSRIGAAAGS